MMQHILVLSWYAVILARTISIISMLKLEFIFSYKKKSEPKAVRFSLRLAGTVHTCLNHFPANYMLLSPKIPSFIRLRWVIWIFLVVFYAKVFVYPMPIIKSTYEPLPVLQFFHIDFVVHVRFTVSADLSRYQIGIGDAADAGDLGVLPAASCYCVKDFFHISYLLWFFCLSARGGTNIMVRC